MTEVIKTAQLLDHYEGLIPPTPTTDLFTRLHRVQRAGFAGAFALASPSRVGEDDHRYTEKRGE